jgi:subtilase family serine protease
VRIRSRFSREDIEMKVKNAGVGMKCLEVSSWKRWMAVCTVVLTLAAALAAQTASQANQRPNRITQAVTSGAMVTVAGTVHPLTSRAIDLGAVDSGMQMEMSLNIGLSPAQKTEIEALLAAQQDPKSPQYHQWLTQEEYGARFGLTDSDLSKVTGWLAAQGFTVKRVSKSRNAIYFGGKAWQVESAFHTQLHQYKLNGETRFANATELQVPAGIASALQTVRGLNNFRLKPQVKVKPEPQYTYSSTEHFLTPGDWATIYNVTSIYTAGYTGTGAHVGVVGQTYAPQADIDNFRSASGLAATKLSYVCIDTSVSCTDSTSISTTGDLGEADLDIEWAGGIAKNATVDFVYAPYSSQYGVFDALQYAVEQYTVPATSTVLPVLSMSYTDCEQTFVSSPGNIDWVSAIGLEANLQGQTIVVASGDAGAFGCDYGNYPASQGVSVSVPLDSPNYTGVGGTTLIGDESSPATYWNQTAGTVISAIKYIPETVWNDTSAANGLSASGGGVSLYFPKPSWQPTPSGYSGTAGRFTPDVSFAASANYNGYMACSQDNNSAQYGTMCANGFFSSGTGQNSVFFVYGGTSAGTPSFAGMLTLLAQKYGPLGNVNPTLYNLAAAQPAIFHDTTSGDNIVPCLTGTTGCSASIDFNGVPPAMGWQAIAGYDMATGLGSVNGGALYTALGGLAQTSVSSLAVSPSLVTINESYSFTLTATVTPTAATGTVSFTVNGVSLGTAVLNRGTATLSVTVTASAANGFSAGSNIITASYSGDATHLGANATATLTVQMPSSVTVTANPTVLAIGGTTTLTATVTPKTATGTVTFKVGNGISQSAIISGGIASLSIGVTATNGFAAGTDAITATYNGDATYAASNTSTSVSLPGYTIATPANPASISAGGSASVTLNLTSIGGYAGTVSFPAITISPATSAVTVSASAATLASGGNGTSTVAITTTASAANHVPAAPWKSGGALVFCAVLLGAPFTLRRKRTLAVLLTALAISLAGFLMSCGGGGSGKAARTYTVTLTPSGSGSTVTNASPVSFVVTVQ